MLAHRPQSLGALFVVVILERVHGDKRAHVTVCRPLHVEQMHKYGLTIPVEQPHKSLTRAFGIGGVVDDEQQLRSSAR